MGRIGHIKLGWVLMYKILSASGQPFTDIDAAKMKASIMSEELGQAYVAIKCEGGFCVVVDITRSNEGSSVDSSSVIIHNPAESEDEYTHTPESDQIKQSNDPHTPHNDAVDLASPSAPEKDLDEQNGGLKRYNQDRMMIKPSMWGYPWMFVCVFLGIFIFIDPDSVSYLLLGGNVTGTLEGGYLLGGKVLGLVIILLALGTIAIDWMANLYIVDLTTIESREGILSKKKMRINIKDIRAIDMNQTIVQRLCVVGTVSLATAGTSGDEIIMERVAYPSELQNVIQDRLDKANS